MINSSCGFIEEMGRVYVVNILFLIYKLYESKPII